jgi:hypothetical protein
MEGMDTARGGGCQMKNMKLAIKVEGKNYLSYLKELII